MVWRTIGRLILIPIALVIAILAAGAVAVTLGLERFTQATHGRWEDTGTLNSIVDAIFQGLPLIPSLTVVPMLAVVIFGEVARIRSMLYYVLGGGFSVLAVLLMAQYSEIQSIPGTVWQVLATSGFAGGFIYWLLAGRSA